MPAARHFFVVSTRRITSGSVTPTITVRLVSPLNPSVFTPTSVFTMSPGMIMRFEGMPWMTSSFTLTHSAPGKPP